MRALIIALFSFLGLTCYGQNINYAGSTIQDTTIIRGGLKLSNLKNKTPISTDSMLVRDINGKIWVVATASGNSGTSGWGLNGNSTTYGNFLGTTNNSTLRIYTNSIQRLSIDSATGEIVVGAGLNTSKLSFKASASNVINIYDGGAGQSYGFSTVGGALQSFASGRFTWNGGGDLQATGANELMSLSTTTGVLNITNSLTVPRITNNLLIGSATTPVPVSKLSFGGNSGGSMIALYDGGAAQRYGFGIATSELQTHIPGGAHFSINKGGDMQTAGTNELIRVDANSGSLLVGTTSVVASSLFTVTSTTKGVLFPRMTTTQRDAILTPAEGLTVYNLTTHQNETYNGTTWAH